MSLATILIRHHGLFSGGNASVKQSQKYYESQKQPIIPEILKEDIAKDNSRYP